MPKLTPAQRAAAFAQSRRQKEAEAWWKPLLSRLVLLVLGLGLLYGGWRCLEVQRRLDADSTTQQIRDAAGGGVTRSARRGSGMSQVITRLPLIGATILLPLGGVGVVASVMPVSLLERFIPTTGFSGH